MKYNTIMCDLDGTLCLYDSNIKSHYSRDFENDDCNEIIKTMLLNYQEENSLSNIQFLTSRDEKLRGQTLKFLRKHFPFNFKFDLIMRESGDIRKSYIVKEELYKLHIRDKYDVEYTFEDRLCDLKMWNELGIYTFNVNQTNKQF